MLDATCCVPCYALDPLDAATVTRSGRECEALASVQVPGNRRTVLPERRPETSLLRRTVGLQCPACWESDCAVHHWLSTQHGTVVACQSQDTRHCGNPNQTWVSVRGEQRCEVLHAWRCITASMCIMGGSFISCVFVCACTACFTLSSLL